MSEAKKDLEGPDLKAGIASSELGDGAMILGQADGKAVLLVRRGAERFAVSAKCTHYGGPLAKGLVVGDTVRCPWHHACFSLRTGEALRAPALVDLPRWSVEERDGRLYLGEQLAPATAAQRHSVPRAAASGSPSSPPESIVIVGGGAAGNSAAETLRREGYTGPVTVLEGGLDAPYDRPNLSKDYLAGTAPEEWIPLHPPSFYEQHEIELLTGRRARSLDVRGRRVILDDGGERAFGALLLATGATPVRLPTAVDPGGRVRYLRTLADSRALVAAAANARRAVILGASFIGLEVAASLRARGLEVHNVAPDSLPLERVLGPDMGRFVHDLHVEHGVVFHLGHTAKGIDGDGVELNEGGRIAADLVMAGIGVRPAVTLAEEAGLTIDDGIVVDDLMATSAPGVFAAGDAARWPYTPGGGSIRVEHWVVAQRLGQAAARNILGHRQRVDVVPFFWSQHYDVAINYVGHAKGWDRIRLAGNLKELSSTAAYLQGERIAALATIYRDRESLEAELAMERGDGAALQALVAH
jgi:NADPH-dependent 2,4-dienoyl-CoA reductase/sulfur reductase-like enzyme/nitrite reductase/ring-hydroxylating ferredoxin subunit